MRENTDQNSSKYGRFSRSANRFKNFFFKKSVIYVTLKSQRFTLSLENAFLEKALKVSGVCGPIHPPAFLQFSLFFTLTITFIFYIKSFVVKIKITFSNNT